MSSSVREPRFGSAQERREYERQYGELLAALSNATPPRLVERFMQLESHLDAGMVEVKDALLVSGLLTSDEDQALGAWIHKQHSDLARLGRCIAEAAAASEHVETGRAIRVLALTLLHWGEAVKWELMVGRQEQREYAMLHNLARLAIQHDRLKDDGKIIVDGLERQATVEALYFRTLLLDRFTSGSLSRQQIEVLDAWLWEWVPSLASTDNAKGPVLRADLDSDQGFRHGMRVGEGPSLYLPLWPLEAERLSVVQQFHAGRIVPTRGRAAQMRIEAHVAVLQQLRRTFSGDESRPPRKRVSPVEVEAWVGLGETTHVFEQQDQGISDIEPSAPVQASRDAFDEVYGKPRRLLTMLDASDGGWLFEAGETPAMGLFVGEILALRLGKSQPCVLARVARRVQAAERGRVHLGIQRLCDPTQYPRSCVLRSMGGKESTYIFVPGSDASGRHDSFVVPYRVLEDREQFLVARGGQEYRLEFNRMRRRGRGWAMAGFEVARAGPPLEFVIA